MGTFKWRSDRTRMAWMMSKAGGVLLLTLQVVLASCTGTQGNATGGSRGGSGGVGGVGGEGSLRGVVKGQRVIGRVEVLTWVIDDGLSQTAAVGGGASTGKTQPGPDDSADGRGGSGGSGGNASAPVTSVRDVGTLPLEAALAEAKATPWPLSARAAAMLSSNGIQAVAVPIQEIDALQKRLRIAGPLRQQYFAQSPRWTEVYRGPMADGVHPIQLMGIGSNPDEMSTVDISRGNFRLLLRNWLAPGEMVGGGSGGGVGVGGVGVAGSEKSEVALNESEKQTGEAKKGSIDATGVSAVMRVDLVPQHFDRSTLAARERDGFTPQRAPTVGELGVTIEPLLMEVTLKGDFALVIFPTGQAQGAGVGVGVGVGSEGTADESQSGTEPSRPFRMLGPDIPALPTLGDAIFSDALVGGPGRARAVLIVIPTLPEFFGGV